MLEKDFPYVLLAFSTTMPTSLGINNKVFIGETFRHTDCKYKDFTLFENIFLKNY